jgi:hypothetical protein
MQPGSSGGRTAGGAGDHDLPRRGLAPLLLAAAAALLLAVAARCARHDAAAAEERLSGIVGPAARGKGLPPRVVMCYTDWQQCDGRVLEAAKGGGCNVVVWSFINFKRADTGDVLVTGGPDVQCFRTVAAALAGAGWEVVHLASVGGWDQAHPDGITPGEAFRAFEQWNAGVGFDGVDWDIEGADEPSSSVCVCVCERER